MTDVFRSTQDRQALVKAKYCPRAMSVQHYVNPGQLVQAVSHAHKNMQKNRVTLTFDV